MEDPLNMESISSHPQQFSFKINDLQIEVKEIQVKEETSGDSQKSSRSKLFFKSEELFLVCLWRGCSFNTHFQWNNFKVHVEEHLSEFRQNQTQSLQKYICGWKGCDFIEHSLREMGRHLHFHSYHTKLQCHGKNSLYSQHCNSTMDWSDIKVPCTVNNKKLPKLKQYRCEWAGCVFQDIDWLQPMDFFDHVNAHNYLGGDGFYQCLWAGCNTNNKKETFASKFKAHMKNHTNEKCIACPNCGSMFTNRVKFFDHCKRQDTQEASFPCGECGKILPTKRIFKDHARAHEKPYNCHLCSQSCSSPSTLKNHMIFKHTTERPFSCELLHCNYTGKTKSDMKIHARKHEKTILQCTSCDYKCKALQTLKNHTKEIHSSVPNTYACHLCAYKTSRGSKLSSHLGSHDVHFSKDLSRLIFKTNPQTGFLQLREDMINQTGSGKFLKPALTDIVPDYDAITDSIAKKIKEELKEKEMNTDDDSMVEALYNADDVIAENETVEPSTADLDSKEVRSRIKTIINDQIQVVENNALGAFFRCKPCGKIKSRKPDLAKHVQSHIEGVSYTCTNCNLEYKTYNSVAVHLFNAKNCKLRQGKKYSIQISSDGLKINTRTGVINKRGRKSKEESEQVDELFDFSIFMGSVGM